MSQWTDAVRKHAVWDRLKGLGPQIDAALEAGEHDAAIIDGLERLRAVLAFSGKRIASLDPFVAAIQPLDALDATILSATNEVAEFIKDRNPARITTANQHASSALVAVSQLTPPSTVEDLVVIGEAASSYRGTLSAYLSEAEKAVEDARGKVKSFEEAVQTLSEASKGLEARLTTVQSEVTTTSKFASDIQAQLAAEANQQKGQFEAAETSRDNTFAASETSRLNAFNGTQQEQQNQFAAREGERKNAHAAEIAREQQEFSDAQASRQAGHDDAQTARQAKFDEAQVARDAGFKELSGSYTSKLTEQITALQDHEKKAVAAYEEQLKNLKKEYEETAGKILKEIEDHKTHVEKLVGVIGNLGVTSGYQKTANEARGNKLFWQFVAVLSLGGWIWFAYSSTWTPPITWEMIASHFLSYIPLVVLAAYAGSQADKLHQTEKRNRKLALEFEAIGPYLAPLPEDMRHQFRVAVGERSFGQDDSDHKVPAAEKSPTTAVDVAGNLGNGAKVVEAVTNMVKAIKG